MRGLIVRDYSGEYELVSSGAQTPSSCYEIYNIYDHGMARQFISRLNVATEAWRGLLMQLGVYIPPNFHHANEILDAVARVCANGKLHFYKLPKIETLKAIPCGQGMCICFVKGPKPHSHTYLAPIAINTPQEAEALIASLTAKDDDLLRCITANGLMKAVSSSQGNRKLIIEKLAAKEILAYKIPVYGNAPPKKQGELIPATGPGYDKVPLAPESKSIAKTTTSNGVGLKDNVPTDIDVKLANSQGVSPAQIQSREKVSRYYLEQNGFTESQISDALGSMDGTRTGGVDLTKPVSVITFLPPEKMCQYVNSHGYPGNWFDPIGNQSPDVLGINGDGRSLAKFTMPQGSGLQTYSKPILDTWTNVDKPIQTNGGGVQLFVSDNVKQRTISLNNVGK